MSVPIEAVAVPHHVLEGIKWIKDNPHFCSPEDPNCVAHLLGVQEFYAAGDWIKRNPQQYLQGMRAGFACEL